MGRVTTIALLERKPSISRSLFSRYWRDVHGVMAARIPGFESYTQYHVTPLTSCAPAEPAPIEGIAIVTFADEADRQGLVGSEMTRHIHRDEQNLFRRALLYNLSEGAARTICRRDGQPQATLFLVFADGHQDDDSVTMINQPELLGVDSYDLTTGDPAAWNDTDVDDQGKARRLTKLTQVTWSDPDAAREYGRRVIADSAGAACAYLVDETYVMVQDGRPTAVGLRGLAAVRTIEEAGGFNQFEKEVVEAIYGEFGRR